MIEKTIYDYLVENGFTVYMERPSRPPEEYVLLEKTASRASNLIVTTTFALQSYASTLYNASQLNEQVKNTMKGADMLTGVSASKLVTDYNFTDTASKHYRYQAVYEITHKE